MQDHLTNTAAAAASSKPLSPLSGSLAFRRGSRIPNIHYPQLAESCPCQSRRQISGSGQSEAPGIKTKTCSHTIPGLLNTKILIYIPSLQCWGIQFTASEVAGWHASPFSTCFLACVRPCSLLLRMFAWKCGYGAPTLLPPSTVLQSHIIVPY